MKIDPCKREEIEEIEEVKEEKDDGIPLPLNKFGSHDKLESIALVLPNDVHVNRNGYVYIRVMYLCNLCNVFSYTI